MMREWERDVEAKKLCHEWGILSFSRKGDFNFMKKMKLNEGVGVVTSRENTNSLRF